MKTANYVFAIEMDVSIDGESVSIEGDQDKVALRFASLRTVFSKPNLAH